MNKDLFIIDFIWFGDWCIHGGRGVTNFTFDFKPPPPETILSLSHELLV